MISAYTLAHPYLLADNRHYTFYIWRKIINATAWSKFALVKIKLLETFENHGHRVKQLKTTSSKNNVFKRFSERVAQLKSPNQMSRVL
jgi:hypothetical protein